MYYKFLTNAPASKKIRSTDWEELSIFTLMDGFTFTGTIKCYRTIGTTATYTYPITVVGNRATLLVSLPSGETFSALSYMEAYMQAVWDGYTVRVTEIRTFVCDQESHYSPIRVGWLNTLGGIDYYTFTGAKSAEAQIERNEYLKDLPIAFSAQDRGGAVLRTEFTEETETVSAFETPTNLTWLKTMLASPEVWIMRTSTLLIPVVVTSKSAIVESPDLIQLKVKFKYANSLLTQNG